MSLDRVLTTFEGDEAQVTAEIQGVRVAGEPQSRAEDSYLVLDTHTQPAPFSPTQPRTKRTPHQARQGGWPPSRWLEWWEVKKIGATVYALVKAGLAPTHLITIMPLASIDLSERKRACRRLIAHVGQALKRHGYPHIGITVFEHQASADLHAHHLIHVPRGERLTIERLSRPPEVHVEPVTDLQGLVGYLTKERRPLSPDFEHAIQRRRDRCLSMPGSRWSLTRAVKELLNAL